MPRYSHSPVCWDISWSRAAQGPLGWRHLTHREDCYFSHHERSERWLAVRQTEVSSPTCPQKQLCGCQLVISQCTKPHHITNEWSSVVSRVASAVWPCCSADPFAVNGRCAKPNNWNCQWIADCSVFLSAIIFLVINVFCCKKRGKKWHWNDVKFASLHLTLFERDETWTICARSLWKYQDLRNKAPGQRLRSHAASL